MYVSSADRALSASKSFHQFARIGEGGAEPLVCEGIDSVDASGADTDVLGHSYLLNSRAIIDDMT
ncbi:MAG TPA: alpha/beta hydrolase, partial [Ktedonobacteraceae bacterium]|nr:alpha/beta hydrolase [Ktedonobacteraceae bacterium]